MVSEELFFDALPCIPILEEWMRRLIFGGEDESDVEVLASPDGRIDLGG